MQLHQRAIDVLGAFFFIDSYKIPSSNSSYKKMNCHLWQQRRQLLRSNTCPQPLWCRAPASSASCWLSPSGQPRTTGEQPRLATLSEKHNRWYLLLNVNILDLFVWSSRCNQQNHWQNVPWVKCSAKVWHKQNPQKTTSINSWDVKIVVNKDFFLFNKLFILAHGRAHL